MTQFIVGTSGLTYDDWQGVFYPLELPKSKWLEYYATQFDAVEINATYYRFFNDKTYIKWRDAVPDHFRYILKVHRLITHRKYLHDCYDLIKRFCDSVSLLENKLGLILLQLAPNMPYDLNVLERALLAFDDPEKVVVEFRNEQWITEETKKMLTELGCIFCDADSPKIKLLDWVTAKTAYIRLHGHKQWYDYNYSYYELKKIAAMANKMAGKKVKKIYLFFNNDPHGYAAKNALYIKKILE